MPTGPEWLAAQYGIEPAELAGRVFRDLNEAAKTVDAARALAILLIRAVEQNAAPHPHLITNGFRITFGAVALTLRRFEDDCLATSTPTETGWTFQGDGSLAGMAGVLGAPRRPSRPPMW